MIIGICGGSGSGKTTLLRRLANTFVDLKPSLFTMDNYYLSIDKQQLDANGMVNFDLPTALNEDQLSTDLEVLARGESIEVKEYHFNSPPDKNVLLSIEPSPLIIVEGLFLFHYPRVKKLLDFSIFVDVEPEIQLDRRLYRDQETRGYSREDILYQWNNHVIPCFENYLFPYKNEADFIYRNNEHANIDFEQLESLLKKKLHVIN